MMAARLAPGEGQAMCWWAGVASSGRPGAVDAVAPRRACERAAARDEAGSSIAYLGRWRPSAGACGRRRWPLSLTRCSSGVNGVHIICSRCAGGIPYMSHSACRKDSLRLVWPVARVYRSGCRVRAGWRLACAASDTHIGHDQRFRRRSTWAGTRKVVPTTTASAAAVTRERISMGGQAEPLVSDLFHLPTRRVVQARQAVAARPLIQMRGAQATVA